MRVCKIHFRTAFPSRAIAASKIIEFPCLFLSLQGHQMSDLVTKTKDWISPKHCSSDGRAADYDPGGSGFESCCLQVEVTIVSVTLKHPLQNIYIKGH